MFIKFDMHMYGYFIQNLRQADYFNYKQKDTKFMKKKFSETQLTKKKQLHKKCSPQQLMQQAVMLSKFSYSSISRFNEALNRLNDGYEPRTIYCRQTQKEQIKNFISDGLKRRGRSETLYISGIPGIGKTLCVDSILNSYRKSCIEKDDKNIIICLNALTMKNPKEIFSLLLEKLGEKTITSPLNAMYKLNQYFTRGYSGYQTNHKINSTKILVIDQIDYLYTKDMQVLYTLLQWTHCKESRLILIAISNTIDFIEHLSAKVASRMGNTKIIFKPYSSKQIQKILRERIQQLGVFDNDGLEYIGKKIAISSSDIRKSLAILRSAIHKFVSQFKRQCDIVGNVTLEHLMNAHQEVFSDKFVYLFKQLPKSHKNILVLIAKYFKMQTAPITCQQLSIKMRPYFMDKVKIQPILKDLKQAGYIKIKYDKQKDKRIDKSVTIHKQFQHLHISLNDGIDLTSILYSAGKDEDLKIVND